MGTYSHQAAGSVQGTPRAGRVEKSVPRVEEEQQGRQKDTEGEDGIRLDQIS